VNGDSAQRSVSPELDGDGTAAGAQQRKLSRRSLAPLPQHAAGIMRFMSLFTRIKTSDMRLHALQYDVQTMLTGMFGPTGKPSPLWSVPPATSRPRGAVGDLIQASRPERSDSVPGSSDGGSMLGKLAALRTTSTAASAAKQADTVEACAEAARAAAGPGAGT
jgi:hypothetical protein